MQEFNPKILKKLYRPKKNSHKGQNGKLLVIGGSELFHSASLWSLEIASKIVDMVFYSSVPVNEEIVRKQKERFNDGIVVPKGKLEEYLEEADVVLIGPGMERNSPYIRRVKSVKDSKDLSAFALKKLIEDGKTSEVINYLLRKYPEKRWMVDGGALQMVDKKLLTPSMIVTPHHQEFRRVFGVPMPADRDDKSNEKILLDLSKAHGGVTIVLKGKLDLISDGKDCVVNKTGNEGMTKGGTGDVLAGLIAAFYCKNEAFLSAQAGVYLNGLAGDRLYERVGPYYNASDLVKELPKVMMEMLI